MYEVVFRGSRGLPPNLGLNPMMRIASRMIVFYSFSWLGYADLANFVLNFRSPKKAHSEF